jgi:hypothetical protein
MFIAEIVIIKVIKQKNENCCNFFAIYVKMMNILLIMSMKMSRGWCLCEEVIRNVAQVEMLVALKKGNFFYPRPNNYKIIFDNQ